MKFVYMAIAAIAVLIVTLSVTLTLPKPLRGGPNRNDFVVGNGGNAVIQGEYLYFANGYISDAHSNLEVKNGGNIQYGAIYRIKAENTSYIIDETTGYVSVNLGQLNNDEENGGLLGAEKVVSRIAGFNNTQIWIFGKDLYFTSPSTTMSMESGSRNISYIDIHRVNTNGTGRKVLYTVKDFSDDFKGSINFYRNGNDVFGVFYNGEKTKDGTITVYKNNSRLTTIKGVLAFAAPEFSQDVTLLGLENFMEGNLAFSVTATTLHSRLTKSGEQYFSYVITEEINSVSQTRVETRKLPNAQTVVSSWTMNANTDITLIGMSGGNLFYSYRYQEQGMASASVFYVKADKVSQATNIPTSTYGRNMDIAPSTHLVLNNTSPSILSFKDGFLHYNINGIEYDAVDLTGLSGVQLLFADNTYAYMLAASQSGSGQSIWRITYGNSSANPINVTGDKKVNGSAPISFNGSILFFQRDFSGSRGEGDELESFDATYLHAIFVTRSTGINEFENQEISSRIEAHYEELEPADDD